MIATTRAAIGEDPVVLIGSSLGGLTAARVAEVEPRVERLVLLAPAFRFAERWRERVEVADHANRGATARVHAGFAREAAAIDVGWPDVRVPTLILHGLHDDVIPVETSRRFAADRPHVRLSPRSSTRSRAFYAMGRMQIWSFAEAPGAARIRTSR